MKYTLIIGICYLLLSCNGKVSTKLSDVKTDTVFIEKIVYVENDPYPSPFNCGDSISQADMNMCAGREYHYYDSIMRCKYDSLLSSFEPSESDDADQKNYLHDLMLKLIASQKAWEKYMTVNAEFVARQWKGGTIMPFMVAIQKSTDTKARIIVLDNLMPEL